VRPQDGCRKGDVCTVFTTRGHSALCTISLGYRLAIVLADPRIGCSNEWCTVKVHSIGCHAGSTVSRCRDIFQDFKGKVVTSTQTSRQLQLMIEY